MKVLVVKTSSMGDVIHCLPAITDLKKNVSSVQVDWVVEEAFQEIPNLHDGVNRVIPVAIRRWRKAWLASRREIFEFRAQLQKDTYDLIVDAQGLIKSAVLAGLAKGPVGGFDRSSIKESVASYAYQRKVNVPTDLHAIHRQRLLFAGLFNYKPEASIDYGLSSDGAALDKDVLFFHGTTWDSKHWPDQNWRELAKLVTEQGYRVVMPYTNEPEKARAEKLCAEVEGVTVLPPGTLTALSDQLKTCAAVVSVDTGPGHLAAAFDKPLVALYGPTSPALTGILGEKQISLASATLPCAPCFNRDCQYSVDSIRIHPPCFESLTPLKVFETLNQQLEASWRK